MMTPVRVPPPIDLPLVRRQLRHGFVSALVTYGVSSRRHDADEAGDGLRRIMALDGAVRVLEIDQARLRCKVIDAVDARCGE